MEISKNKASAGIDEAGINEVPKNPPASSPVQHSQFTTSALAGLSRRPQRQTAWQEFGSTSLGATEELRAMATGSIFGVELPHVMPAGYDKGKAKAFPNLRDTCPQYHVKENYPKNISGLTRWNTGTYGVKTQRKQVTLQRHRGRILTGDKLESLVNVIGQDKTGKGNTVVVVFSPQGKAPSFYGIHPADADGKNSWYPMDPGDKSIPHEYSKGWNYRLGGAWGDELQYDSDGGADSG